MPFLITLGFVETLFDLVIDRVKRELVGTTTIRRAIVDDGEFHVLNEDMIDTSLRVRVNIGVGVGASVDLGCGIDAGAGGKSVEATSWV
ncbi:hypothetical protein MTR67_012575 [Solanum verrucosum]|uniref:Uncharacterized protein n=1 Tax=Solanum verrucosum TaxID=315347 RepID=A0AAF0QBK1_SOLVR|nr:hypothetical protein MTR67_012575 [Solanum verrucosum]